MEKVNWSCWIHKSEHTFYSNDNERNQRLARLHFEIYHICPACNSIHIKGYECPNAHNRD